MFVSRIITAIINVVLWSMYIGHVCLYCMKSYFACIYKRRNLFSLHFQADAWLCGRTPVCLANYPGSIFTGTRNFLLFTLFAPSSVFRSCTRWFLAHSQWRQHRDFSKVSYLMLSCWNLKLKLWNPFSSNNVPMMAKSTRNNLSV